MKYLTAFVCLFFSTILIAQPFEYLGLADKNITSMTVNYNTIAVGTDSGGVFWKNESLLQNEEWKNINLKRKILSVYPHKSGPVGWAITAGVEKSLSDSGLIYCSYLGEEFVANSAGIDYEQSSSVIDIDGFPDPTICGETYAVTGDALYRRNFEDTTWTRIREAWEGGFNCVKTKIDYPGVVMIGGATGFAGILLEKSTDFGDSWDNISPFGAVTDIDFTGDSAEMIFTAAYPDVFRTTDNGTTWEKIFLNDRFLIFDNILYDYHNQILFVSGFEGLMSAIYPVLLFSSDMGDTWQRMELDFRDEILDLEYSSNGGDWIYIAMRNNGVFRFKTAIVGADNTEANKGPAHFKLFSNYPNPFNPSTTIEYSIPVGDANFASPTNVKLIIYDVLGREVATLVNGHQIPGTYQVEFDGSRLASGIYYCSLKSGNFSETRKMLLIR